MAEKTLYLRVIHPNWASDGLVNSQAFRPSPKDEGMLSVFDGSIASAEECWDYYTQSLGLQASCLMAITAPELLECGLSVVADPRDHPAHALIDFRSLSSNKSQRRAARLLADFANARGVVFAPKS